MRVPLQTHFIRVQMPQDYLGIHKQKEIGQVQVAYQRQFREVFENVEVLREILLEPVLNIK